MSAAKRRSMASMETSTFSSRSTMCGIGTDVFTNGFAARRCSIRPLCVARCVRVRVRTGARAAPSGAAATSGGGLRPARSRARHPAIRPRGCGHIRPRPLARRRVRPGRFPAQLGPPYSDPLFPPSPPGECGPSSPTLSSAPLVFGPPPVEVFLRNPPHLQLTPSNMDVHHATITPMYVMLHRCAHRRAGTLLTLQGLILRRVVYGPEVGA